MSAETGEKVVELLIPLEMYLQHGVHIGTKMVTNYMKRFVYKRRNIDGLAILDVRKIDQRIRVAAKFLSRFEPEKIMVVSVRQYGHKPVTMFAQFTGAKPVIGRFVPGTLTNPALEVYYEPDVILVTDTRMDQQAIVEAAEIGIPVVAICDTDNKTENVDLIIPGNNKGRKSLALLYWLLTRQVLVERGQLSPDAPEDQPAPVSEFETKVKMV
ncbi:30S ribosomal protein S2 [Ignicoccus hospitalis]|uniref:Small ribosomal subunit protein uS2 n=1 Tax=Ignicoccus hospitalis (strain KIN4/I / DSM 18386 / JCM 14125) TaxID=453591 RepID=RS2_IGNH4|nr:30S ribosomal protein S2 [Ignicoccus hospitalis]A8A8X0.1 RecName: Full=Small ribosomal subunit protein uS2; AltName: Full=30S ribosomal protein S2 [Ignicoccus hospitalis KIN4/I]ABU81372.1 SSU ribosomal protein S2P [Ignicoccus hospitalis KIN4/I]HIH90324.1 30S ribosomal protein S2 [Desulfurococcaceae archaeon]